MRASILSHWSTHEKACTRLPRSGPLAIGKHQTGITLQRSGLARTGHCAGRSGERLLMSPRVASAQRWGTDAWPRRIQLWAVGDMLDAVRHVSAQPRSR